jgi:hypothetical protein
MAPLPKAPEQRVRRNAGQAGWRTLPAAESFKRPPALPARKPAWLASTRAWWAVLWRSPMASAYVEADVAPLVRLAEMVDARARGALLPAEMAAMVALEDRFGLNPKARRALQWEIAQAGREAPERPVGNVPKLRAVSDA